MVVFHELFMLFFNTVAVFAFQINRVNYLSEFNQLSLYIFMQHSVDIFISLQKKLDSYYSVFLCFHSSVTVNYSHS